MANWCSTQIEFSGSKKNIKNLHQLFERTVEMQNIKGEGQLLFGLEGVIDGYMFSIEYDLIDDDYFQVTYESKWNPLPHDMVRIAQMFKLTFISTYQEEGNQLYGVYNFDGTNLSYKTLSDEELEACKYVVEDYGSDDDVYTEIDYEKAEDFLDNKSFESMEIRTLKP